MSRGDWEAVNRTVPVAGSPSSAHSYSTNTKKKAGDELTGFFYCHDLLRYFINSIFFSATKPFTLKRHKYTPEGSFEASKLTM
jgi:hypothetical protein